MIACVATAATLRAFFVGVAVKRTTPELVWFYVDGRLQVAQIVGDAVCVGGLPL